VTGRPSSPLSTGGAGVIFENHVAAIMLSRLIRGASVPVGIHGPISRVAFQQGNEGYPLDDVVAHADPFGAAASIQVQVKRRIQVTASDPELVKVMAAAVEAYRARPNQVAEGRLLFGLAARGSSADHLDELTELTVKARSHAEPENFDNLFLESVTGKPMRDRYRQVSAAVAAASGTEDVLEVKTLTHQILRALHVWNVAEGPDGRDWRAELDGLADLAAESGKSPADIMAHLYTIAGGFGPRSGLVDAEHVRRELRRFAVYLPAASTGVRRGAPVFTVNNNANGTVFAAETQTFHGLSFGNGPTAAPSSQESGQRRD
jgi:hypothetical protein